MSISIEVSRQDNTVEISLKGDADIKSVSELKSVFEEYADIKNPNIILDFKEVKYIDSTGLGALVSLIKKVNLKGGKTKIINLKKYLYKIFEITGLNTLFDIEVV